MTHHGARGIIFLYQLPVHESDEACVLPSLVEVGRCDQFDDPEMHHRRVQLL